MTFDPYASALPFFDSRLAPAHVVSPLDKSRLQSYELYEKIYWTAPQTFRILQRGQDAAPIYLPSARKMIEACNRFLAVDFGYTVQGTESQEEKLRISALVSQIFKREKFFTKFATQKRYGLIRGDALWHFVADPFAAPGERLSIYELDPATYFPIYDKDNLEKRIGCHIVDIITDPKDANGTKKVARRQTYRKDPATGLISSELAYFEPNAWDDRHLKPQDIKRVRTIVNRFDLPSAITALPVYEVPNNRIPGKQFGYSEIMGIERVFAAVNQAVSDQELSLAMAGLGVFWTTAGPPKRDNEIVPWEIGPATMIEIGKENEIGRLQGISSVAPMIDHMEFMLRETQGGIGIPDIAAGKVDVAIAESGISLQLQLAPLLAKNAEKEQVLIEVHDQFFYDLVHGWLVAYEDVPTATTATAVAVTGDPMPKNIDAEIDRISRMVESRLITIEEGRTMLARLGVPIEASSNKVIEEAAKLATAVDPFLARIAEESGQVGQGEQGNNGVPVPGAIIA